MQLEHMMSSEGVIVGFSYFAVVAEWTVPLIHPIGKKVNKHVNTQKHVHVQWNLS